MEQKIVKRIAVWAPARRNCSAPSQSRCWVGQGWGAAGVHIGDAVGCEAMQDLHCRLWAGGE